MGSAPVLRFLVFSLVVLFAANARALPGVSVTTNADPRRVELGGEIQVEVRAMSSTDDSPTDPSLVLPPGFGARGPSVSSRSEFSMSTSSGFMRKRGISATWMVAPNRAGSFTIGPSSVLVGGARADGPAITVEVVPAGSLPAPGPRRGRGRWPFDFDPFDQDPFGGFPKVPGIDDDRDPLHLFDTPAPPAEFPIEHATDPIAFLRATATPRRVVVGEQVTLDILAYGSRGPFRETYTSEPARADFIAYPLVDNSTKQPVYEVTIDGSPWRAVRVRKIALFGLHAGKLAIGPMRMGFDGRGYPPNAAHRGLVRYSAPLEVEAVEPPIAGRPPGYQIGDVGDFALQAEVTPRRIHRGEAVSVVVRIEGTGNLPSRVRVPEKKGIDWREPTTKESIETSDSSVKGSRTLTYVVAVDAKGKIDLGAVTLPFWHPGKQAYEVARAALGNIVVDAPAGGVAPKPSAPEKQDPLANILVVRPKLGAPSKPATYFTDRREFWLLLLLGPLGVLGARAAASAVATLRDRMRARRASAEARARDAFGDARASAARGDLSSMASAIERALMTAVEGASGLKARGVLRSELPQELVLQGIPSDVAAEIVGMLDRCDEIRFTGGACPDPRDFVERAARAARKVPRGARPRKEAA